MPHGARTSNRALTTLVGIVAVILLGWVLTGAAHILQPLVIAILLCNILQPVVRALAQFRIPSWVTVIALMALLVVGLERGATLLYKQARSFVDEQGGFAMVRVQLEAKAIEADVPQPVIDALKEYDLAGDVVALIGTLPGFIRGLFLVGIYMLFIFAEQTVFRRKILAVFETRAEDAEQIINSISYGIQRYLGVKTVTSLATGVLCYSVLLYLQIPYALLFGFFTFALNYIPTFGSIAAAVFPVAVAYANSGGFTDPIIVAVTYLVVNVVLGTLIEPRLLGRELNLSPLVILVSVLVWSALWGIPGLFLAVPLTATAQIMLANIESTRPIAILLSNGPPKEGRRLKLPRRPSKAVAG